MWDEVVHGGRSGDRDVGRGYLGLAAHKIILSCVEWRHGFRPRGYSLADAAGVAGACSSDHNVETSMNPDFCPNKRFNRRGLQSFDLTYASIIRYLSLVLSDICPVNLERPHLRSQTTSVP